MIGTEEKAGAGNDNSNGNANGWGANLSTFTLVFRGAVLPGFSVEEAKAHAALLFKLTPEKAEALFGGSPVVLRKSLPAAELEAYQARIARAGMQVEVKPDAIAPLENPVVTNVDAPPPAASITCPQCGELQPKRTLCLKCGTDMPRVIAAREQAEQEVRAERQAARTAPARGEANADYAYTATEDAQPFFGTSLQGRISRTRYLQATLITYALMGVMFIAVLHSGFALFAVLGVLLATLVICFWSLRMTALRLHDIGITAWAMLLMLIPVVQLIFSVALLLIPGKAEDNDWGQRAPQAGGAGLVMALVLTVLVAAIGASQAERMHQLMSTLEASAE